MGAIRVVREADRAIGCYQLLDGMAQAAIPLAERDGKWEVLGDLYVCRMPDKINNAILRGAFAFPTSGSSDYDFWMARRSVHFAHLADEAYARAGRPRFRPGDYAETCGRTGGCRQIPSGRWWGDVCCPLGHDRRCCGHRSRC